MFKYIVKRLLLAILALFILLALSFFLMKAIPGYPIEKPVNMSDEAFNKQLQDLGLLDNPVTQFFNFLRDLFVYGRFGRVYNGATGVIEKALVPMKYTIIVALPAFVLSAVIGIGLGILSARFRGKAPDIIANVFGILCLSVPSFIFALYLVKLAGVIGLPTQFVGPGQGSISEQIKSIIMPIVAMTLSSITTIMYYTRNEMIDVLKQDYIKTALAKGISINKIVFTHALKNAAIPILAILGPSLIAVLSGSIIIEKFFGIPGSSSVLVDAIQGKETFIVVFCVLFYSGIYFLMQIIIDVSFTFLDPRIKIASKSGNSIFKMFKVLKERQKVKNSVFNGNFNLFAKVENFAKLDESTKAFYLNYFSEESVKKRIADLNISQQVIQTESGVISQQVVCYNNFVDILKQGDNKPKFSSQSIYSKIDLPTHQDIELAKQQVNPILQPTQKYELSTFLQSKIKKESFHKHVGNSYSNEQIAGKPTTYWGDVFRRLFKSKTAIVFSIILLGIILFGLIFSLSAPNSANMSIGDLSSNIVAYLPPRVPILGMSGVVHEQLVSQDVYYQLARLKEQGYNIYQSAIQVGSSWKLINYNPYVLPELKDVYPIMGTDGLGRDCWNMMWYSTIKSLTLAIIASAGSVILGTIYGSISGAFAGKTIDTLMMRVVEIISSIPIIVWVMIISTAISGGTLDIFTICLTLIITSWMGSAIISRTFIIKYKDAEFVQAAQTLGASKFRIIFTHLLPNTIGRLLVVFVDRIPVIIFFETSLVFLGIKSSNEVSLGTMINSAYQDGYWWMLLGPTLTLVLTTLSTMMIANSLSDALDPKIVN